MSRITTSATSFTEFIYLVFLDGNQFYNKIWIFWNDTKLESNRISLWVYDDKTRNKKEDSSGKRSHKLVEGGFIPIDTVQGLLKDYHFDGSEIYFAGFFDKRKL